MRNYVPSGRSTGTDRSNGLAIIAETDAAGCFTGTLRAWPNALPPHRSPCRHDVTKGVQQHRCSAHHASLVESYRATREYEERAAEEATSGYATELAEYWQAHPRTTFRDYLIHGQETPS